MKKKTKDDSKSEEPAKLLLDRKTFERNRRSHMKLLFFKLFSLIPKQHRITSDIHLKTLMEKLEHAILYIKKARKRVEELKGRLMALSNNPDSRKNISTDDQSVLPILELRELDLSLEVILITGLNKNFMFYQIINVLEEGVEVVNASLSTVGDRIIHTIHSRVSCSRVGIKLSRVCEKLKELVY